MKIGFVGLGIMGESMCENIIKKHDDKVYVFDYVKEKVDKLAALGAVPCSSSKEVAENENVPFIDLTQMTTDMLEAYGPSDSTKFYVHYPAGAYSDDALKDDTHFNPFGAFEVAKCIIMGLKNIKSPIVDNLRDDWKDFNPEKPDDWQEFVWVDAPSIDSLKPDGN